MALCQVGRFCPPPHVLRPLEVGTLFQAGVVSTNGHKVWPGDNATSKPRGNSRGQEAHAPCQGVACPQLNSAGTIWDVGPVLPDLLIFHDARNPGSYFFLCKLLIVKSGQLIPIKTQPRLTNPPPRGGAVFQPWVEVLLRRKLTFRSPERGFD